MMTGDKLALEKFHCNLAAELLKTLETTFSYIPTVLLTDVVVIY